MFKMKKIILLIMLVIFITGCTQSGTTSGTPDGLHITFIQPNEGDEIDEDSEFYVALEVDNRADFEIQGSLCLSDTYGGTRSAVQDDCTFITVDENSKYQDLNPFGPYSYTDVVSGENVLKATLVAEVEYPNSFVVTPIVCVRPFNLDNEGEEECKGKETLTVSTAGFVSAPITVSKIIKELKPSSNIGGVKANLNIYLKKMSEGRLEGPLNIYLDYGEGETKCKDLDKFEWDEGDTEKIINCEILIETMTQELVENQLIISLDYNYYQKETISINLVNSDEGNWV